MSHDDRGSAPTRPSTDLDAAGPARSPRGFAALGPAQQRLIASRGGKAAHVKGVAHLWTSDEARQAGRQGGRTAHARGTAHQWSTDEARRAGSLGGLATRLTRRRQGT